MINPYYGSYGPPYVYSNGGGQRNPSLPVYVQPSNRGATDEAFLSPAQRANRRKIHSGCYAYHDRVTTSYKIYLRRTKINEQYCLKNKEKVIFV